MEKTSLSVGCVLSLSRAVKIMLNITKSIAIALTSITSLGAIASAVKAQPLPSTPIPQQVINGLYPNSSERYFQEGRDQFELEIESLIEGKYPPPEEILKISDDLLQQGDLSPTDKIPVIRQKKDLRA
jgi:hypothetical protein